MKWTTPVRESLFKYDEVREKPGHRRRGNLQAGLTLVE